jgi:DNA-binding transcriptional regulator YiaG
MPLKLPSTARTEDVVTLARVRSQLASGEAQRIRENAHVSRAEMARSLGVDRLTLRRWETGETQPYRETALRLAWVLDLLQEHGRGS